VSWPLRLVSAVFFLIQPFVCCPAAFAQAVVLAQTSQAENPADGEPGLNMPSGEPVAVNKTLPLFTPPGNFALSANPSDDQITRCGLFAEPLVPLRPRVAGAEANTENTALATALKRYAARTDGEDVSALSDFCAQNAESRWEAAMQHNLGLIAYHQGYFSQALAHWEQAWEIGKKATQFQAVALANESLAQLMRMNARLGRMGRVKVLLADAENRKLTGNAASMLSDTKDALALMQNDPSHSFRCGPLALAQIRASLKIRDNKDAMILAAPSTSRGCSLAQVAQLAQAADLDYQIAKRDAGALVITPAVVHWKVGHYAALVKEAGGKLLSKDLTFGNNTWLSQKALDAEASGYFLVPKQIMPVR
jgi:peptidase C39-like protein